MNHINALREDKDYIATVIALKQASPPDRQKILHKAAKPLRPTWAELGRISREGQTEAGQQAERLIGEAVVEMTTNLLQKSEMELQAMYNQ